LSREVPEPKESSVSLHLTDEQNTMVATIREFAARECGRLHCRGFRGL